MPSSLAPPPPGPPPGWVPPPSGFPAFGSLPPPGPPPGPPPTLAASLGPSDRVPSPYGSPYLTPAALGGDYSTTNSWDPRKGPVPHAAAAPTAIGTLNSGYTPTYGGPSPHSGHSPRPSQSGPSGHLQGTRMYIPVHTWASTQSPYRSTTYYRPDV